MDWEAWREVIAAWLLAALLAALLFTAMLALETLDNQRSENALTAPATSVSNPGTTPRDTNGIGDSSDSCSDIDYAYERC
jgi:hypothetical protein